MKKVLIITYYWPPAGGSGVQRWLYFVKHLREFDIDPIVYVPKNPAYPVLDKSLQKAVPDGITILRHPIREPNQLIGRILKKQMKNMSSGIIDEPRNQSWFQKVLLFIRGNFFIPDARVLWVKPSVKFLSHYLSQSKIDTVITTGPPHSMHLIGLKLKEKLNIKWIADFRDPWTDIHYQAKLPLTKKSTWKHQKLEENVLQIADVIITTSFKTGEDFKKRTQKPVEVITNGFEPRQETNLKLDEKFIVSHIGLLTPERNPDNLWRVFSEMVKENPVFRENFKLRLIGEVSQTVIDSIKDAGLTSYMELTGYVPHEKALEFQVQSQVLLLIEVNDTIKQSIIPGKLFEYLGSKRPIIAIGPKGWDVKKIIGETESGRVFDFTEKDKLKQTILCYFEAYKKGDLTISSKKTDKYHRRELTRALSGIIKKTWR